MAMLTAESQLKYLRDYRANYKAETESIVRECWSSPSFQIPEGECWLCGTTKALLTFDHVRAWDTDKWGYAPDSVRVGSAYIRQKEARRRPWGFWLVCFKCNRNHALIVELQRATAEGHGLTFDVSTGMGKLLAMDPGIQQWRNSKLAHTDNARRLRKLTRRGFLPAGHDREKAELAAKGYSPRDIARSLAWKYGDPEDEEDYAEQTPKEKFFDYRRGW